MKKSKKALTLNKLVISKLTNPTSIMGGSKTCTPGNSNDGGPFCPPPPPPTTTNDPLGCTVFVTRIDC